MAPTDPGALLASLVASSDDAIVAKTREGVVVHWNAAAERIYGYSAEEMVGRSIFAVVPDDRVEELQRIHARIRRGERVAAHETVRRRKDGSLFPVSVTISPILDGDGNVTGMSTIARDIEADLALRDAVRRREAEWKALFEQASDGIFIADLDGRYTDVNEAGCEILRLRRDQIVGRRIVDILLPAELPRLAESREILLAGGTHVAEWTLRRGDGVWLPVEVSAKVLPDGRWQGFVRDIGPRKALEAEVRRAHEAELALRRELENVMQAHVELTEAVAELPQSGLELALRTLVLQAQAMTGAEMAALGIGVDPEKPFDPWVYVGVPDDLMERMKRPPRPVGTLGVTAREGRVLRVADARADPAWRGVPEGHPEIRSLMGVPITFRGRPAGNLYLANKKGAGGFTDDDERLVMLLAARTGAAVETARLYQNETLQRLWLQAVFEQMPEGVLILDERGRVLMQNTAARRLARDGGESAGDGVPLDLRAPSGEPIPAERQPLHRALRGEMVAGEEVLVKSATGDLVSVMASAAPIRAGDRVAGVVGVFQDIRALKEIERLREEWAAIVAHDLRQPVFVIGLAVNLLRRTAGGALVGPALEHLERIEAAAAGLARMVEDLLDASRVEARRLSVELREVDLAALVRHVARGPAATAGGRELRIEAPEALSARVDPQRIEQVLGNLLSNAAKYGTPGTPITLRVSPRGPEVEVAVVNLGPGIPPEELEVLFSRFFRTRAARAGAAMGLGLGLYISKGLVEAHGGRMWAESTPGGETSFHFTVPAA